MPRRLFFSAASVLSVTLAGCLHMPLKRNFLDQSSTISDIEHQQVIDNLAKFAANPASLPHFAIPDSGTTAMSAQGNGNIEFSYTRVLFSGWKYSFGGNAQEQENWVLKPVNDPGRLRRLRCAFQLAVNAHPAVDHASDCYACIAELKKMGMVVDETTREVLPTPTESSAKIEVVPDPEMRAATLNCNFPRDWYGVGCKKDVPKCACYVGRYCDTYVWVQPESMDEFTRFTLTVLTLATTDPPGPAAEVERTLDAAGAVTGYKVKTKENIKFEPIPQPETGATPSMLRSFIAPAPTQRVIPQGPISELRRDDTFPSSAIQGLLQLRQD